MPDLGMLIVVSGPSGVGKDTVVNQFLQQEKSGRFCLSVSTTTREARPGDEEGVDYYFVKKDRFQRMVRNGEMLEYAEYGGNLYGTPRETVEKLRAQGKHVILVIEVQGAAKVRALCPDSVSVFILPPSMEELRNRLAARGTEKPGAIDSRIEIARRELLFASEYDYVLVNSDLKKCIRQLETVLVAASLSPRHRPYLASLPEPVKERTTNA